MNTRILIFGLLILLSCKKAEVKPVEQPITQSEPTPVVKTPKLFNIKGKWQTIIITVNQSNIIPPVNVYKGDTVLIKAYSNINDISVDVYFDGKYFDNFYGKWEVTKQYIVE